MPPRSRTPCDRGIFLISLKSSVPDSWIVDPERSQITILTLVAGFYEEAVFQGDERLTSAVFPDLALTAAQVLTPT